MFAVFIAALVPDLAPFISLIGAVFFSILGLMCPAVIHLAAFWDNDDADEDGGESGGDSDCCTEEEEYEFDGGSVYYAVDNDADLQRGQQQQRQQRRSSWTRRPQPRRRRRGMSRWAVAKDVAIVLIALIALVSGTYASLVDIVAFYGGEGGTAALHGENATAAAVATTIGPGPESAFLIAQTD